MKSSGLFHEKFTDKDSVPRESDKWTFRYKGIRGEYHKLTVSTNSKVSLQVKNYLERLWECRLARESIPYEIREWLEAIPDDWRSRFVSCGLLDQKQSAAAKVLNDHIEDYREFRSQKDGSKDHDKQELHRVSLIACEGRFQYWNDITGAQVQSVLTRLKKEVP